MALSTQALTARASVQGDAIGALWTLIGGDKAAIHAAIVGHVGTIIALALCKAPPKGIGNPADHAKLPELFEASKGGKRYAPYCAAFPQALKGRTRSIEAWEEAQERGAEIACAAFGELAPKTYTVEQMAEREAKRAEKKAEREKEAKKAEREAKALQREELAAEFARGAASVQAPILTAQMVADMIRAGAFDADGLAVIRAALPIGATVETVQTAPLALA